MAIHRIRLDNERHASFLSEERRDPITKELLVEGMYIVICANDKYAFSSDSWQDSCPLCHCTNTLSEIPRNEPLIFERKTTYRTNNQTSSENPTYQHLNVEENYPSSTDNKFSLGIILGIFLLIIVFISIPKIIHLFTEENSTSASKHVNQPTVISATFDIDEDNRYVSLPTETLDSCFGIPETRMSVGMLGRVTYRNNVALILRSSPQIGKSTFTKNLAEGTRIRVIGGPICAEGYLWWKIRTREGAEGWSAEGTWSEYYMEPFDWSEE